MPMIQRPRLRSLLLVLWTILLSVNGLIVGVALYSDAAAPTVVAYANRPRIEHRYFVIDAQLGWKLSPGLTVDLVEGDGSGREPYFTTDAQGHRVVRGGDSRGAEILVLGDSFVQGYYLYDDETIPARLQERSGRSTLNAGVGGYSTDQQYLLLRRLLRDERPKHVVLIAFANDLPYLDQESAWALPKPRFRVEEGVLDTSQVLPPPISGRMSWQLDSLEVSLCCLPGDWPGLNSSLGGRLSQSYGMILQPVGLLSALQEQIALTKPREHQFQIVSDGFYTRPEVFRADWELFFQLLLHMRIESARTGAEFTVMFLPEIAQIVREEDLLAPQRLFLRGCERLELDCLEPSATFIEQHRQEDLFFMDDGHLSPRGADLTARILADHLAGR
jgi:lysophospholipase L1-like esterase